MNALSYKVIFSKRLGTLVAVGEHTSSSGKSGSGQASRAVITSFADGFVGGLRYTFASVALACLTMGVTSAQSTLPKISSTALPQGGSVNSGSIAISSSGTQMALLQTTDKASVNWQSFNIGSSASVNIVQPSASAVLLNRVVGNDPSQILGKLSANGQVILLNPNGIAFGKDGSVTASSFTASTFALSEQDFAASVYKYQRNGSTAQVVNQGSIQTQAGGFVALVGATVSNEGKITAPQGDVVLAAAESVTLPAAAPTPTPANVSVRMSKRVRLEVAPAAINTAVNNAQSGVILTEGGQVLMQAASLSDAVASVTMSGRIDTTAPYAGAVTLLADGGQIKVSGNITANSTKASNKGGDIIIGRDVDTGVLARATDVSGASLESLGGFIETSGNQLQTAGISVKAKDWLLDPTDINIVATGTATPDSPSTSASGTTTYQETAGINTSEVLKSTIESAINGGTSVTITTDNSTAGANGAGNITLSTALSFSNTGATDATLTLLAKNGITQNAGASITTNSVTSTKLVNVVMTSEGLYGGAAGASASSAGIRLNSTINTNGDVTLSGTTNNSGAASSSNAIGVDTASAAAITARNISITGSSQSSFGIQSASALTASGNITLDGTSKNWVGVVTTGSVIATGALSITGTKTSAAGYQGANIHSNLTGNSIAINGTGINWDAVQFNNGVTLNATTTLNVTGVSTSAKGVYFLGTNTFNAERFLINATSTSGYGIHFSGSSTLNTASYDIKATTSAASTNALYFTGGTYTFNSTSTTTNSLIEATRTATGGDSIFAYSGATVNLNSGAGKTTMATSTTNVGGGIRLGFAGGSVVNTSGDVTIGSKNSANAYFMNQGTINALTGNLTLKAQSTSEAFYLQDGGGAAARIVGTNGANITIDGTSTGAGSGVNLNYIANAGHIVSTGGVSSSGSAGSISITGVSATGSGIFKNAATITNTNGAITLNGTSSGGTGIGVVSGTGAISSSADLTIVGVSTGGNGVYSTGAYTSTGASVSVTGTSGTSSALSLQGAITASQNVTLTGTNTAAGNATATVYTNKAVTATNGTIAVTANTSGTTASALQLASGAALSTTNRSITLSTDSLSIDTTGGAGASINAGTNTVTLQNRSSGVLVNVGGSDVGNATATSRTLGLTNAELNRVTAGSLLIGSSTAGNLTVSSATTLADSRGNISLITGGNIALSSNLETTGTGQSLTLTAANGSISGAGNITTAVGNTASITLDAATAGTLSGLISGGGSMVKQGSATMTLTGANSYSGTTTISSGTLQVGNAGVTGALGSGAVVNNAALIFNRDATADLTVSSAISGTGTVSQSGAGKTILSADNSYSGATSVSGGTLQIGNATTTGTLGTASAVTLSNNATLAFNRTANTTIDKTISGVGNVTANITGDLALTSNIALTGTNTINLTASGAITETAGSLAATNLYLTATNGGIGAIGNRIQSSVTNLSFSGGGDVFVTEANAVTISGRTTANNGNINVATTNGTMAIGSVNSINGMTANGTGNINLTGNATTGNGITISNVITASNGDVSLSGTTASTTNPNAGVYSQSTVSAKNITMVAESTSTTGSVLGYYGAGGVFNASQSLNLSGMSHSSGNGLYTYTGSYLSGTGMTLVGSSGAGQAIGFDAGVTVTNTTSGGISMSGTATNGTQQALGMRGVAITNGGGNVSITATNGVIFSDAGNPAWGGVQTNTIVNSGTGAVQMTAGNSSATNSGSIDGSVFTITQNGNAGVVVSTSGTGNVTAPKIINAGTGDIVVAAGTAIAAGTATGGQILTVANNTLTQTNATPGKTYVYSGSADTTGVLSNLSTGFASLYYQGTSQALNAGFNQGFDANHANDMSVPGGGSASSTQVFFRSTTKPGFSMTLANASKAYGETDPTLTATNGATLTNTYAGVGGNNTFAVASADVIAGMTGSRVAGENVGTYAYTLSSSSFNTTLTAQPNLVIGKRDITLATITASNKTYNGFADASITSGTFGNLYNNETLLISGTGTFSSKDVANGKTVTVADTTTLTKTNGTGNWNNYNLTTTSKTTTANITKATLTATANADARFVTQTDAANFNGVSYSGFVGGDTSAVLGGALSISRTNALTDVAAATYTGVLVPTGLTATNYTFAYTNGNYTIVPADRLLVNTTSQAVTYGTTPSFTTTAKYLDSSSNTIKVLTQTGTNNNYTYNDGAGTTISLALKPYTGASVATLSTSGNTVAGTYDVKDTAYVQNGANFNGTPVFIGTLTVAQKALTPSASGASKVYDGSTSTGNVVIGMTGKVTNDVVSISGNGAFSQKDVGTNLSYSISGITLASADAGNYYISGGPNSISANDGTITAKALTLTASSVANKVYDGNTNATVNSAGNLQGLIGTETLALNGVTGTFASAAIGSAKPVTVAATLADGTNGGLASNYTLSAATAFADITATNNSGGGGGSSTTSTFYVVPRPITPTESAESANASNFSTAGENNILVVPALRPSGESCTPNNLEDCLCETQETRAIEGIQICYQPKKTANATQGVGRKS